MSLFIYIPTIYFFNKTNILEIKSVSVISNLNYDNYYYNEIGSYS